MSETSETSKANEVSEALDASAAIEASKAYEVDLVRATGNSSCSGLFGERGRHEGFTNIFGA
ncbi:hypothetical protein [Paenibacillus oryzae]|uniref:hypothetical protein n=1 Tax=Paenibacillus oryzae TaxID=1844972 RepID=UPI001B801CA7|nr:hypothetical protein [Paenibacillus oryzae]